jgi:hypothetical protein
VNRPATNLRWYIGGLLFLSTVINYIDRQTLSVLAPYLKIEYTWTNTDFAWLIIAFRVAYSFGQTLAGKWLDRVGTRTGLSLAVLWYSVAAMLTSTAVGLKSFAVFRFLLGAGEAANWPGATKAVSEWFPRRESGWAVALFDSITRRRRTPRSPPKSGPTSWRTASRSTLRSPPAPCRRPTSSGCDRRGASSSARCSPTRCGS